VRVTPQGNPINSFVIAAVSGVQTHPSLIFNGTDYITVWSDCRLGRYYINSTRITPSGTIPGPNYWIGIAGTNDEDSPDIAYNGNHSLCVWSEENTGVKGRFIDNLGQPEDTVLTIAFFTSTTYTSPALASDGDNFLIVWYERRSGGSDWDILGQLVSAQGSLIGTPITIATGGNSQYDTDVVFDGVDYFVVWRETTYHIYVVMSILKPAALRNHTTDHCLIMRFLRLLFLSSHAIFSTPFQEKQERRYSCMMPVVDVSNVCWMQCENPESMN